MKPKYQLLFMLPSLLALFILCLLSSCSILKTKATITKDSTVVAKRDSGSVKKNEGQNKEEKQWYKETVYYGHDTTINNFYTQPTVVIREGGKSNNESSYKNNDSSWRRSIDSLKTALSQTTKTKEEKVLTFWQIVGIAGGASVVIFLLSKLLSNVKISNSK